MVLAVSLSGDLVPIPPGGGSSSPLNWVNVTQAPYNATGDGTTDDTAAIQSAINTGHTVYFPSPSVAYKCEGLYPTKTGQQFICENPRFSKFIPVTTGGHIWDLTLNVPIDPISGQFAQGYAFDGFRIQGTQNGSTGSIGCGWFADNGSPLGDNITWRNCVVQGMGDAWNLNGLGNCSFIQCQAQANLYGLVIGNTTGNSFSMLGLQCTQNFTWNVWWKRGYGTTIILADGNYGGATSAYNSAGGIRIGDGSGPTSAYVTLLGSNFEEQAHSSGVAIQIEGGSRVVQFNALFQNQAGSTAPPVVVKSLNFYEMHNVGGGANNIPVQCESGATVTGDGALVSYGTNDAAGGVLVQSGMHPIRFDNEVPLQDRTTVGSKVLVVPRNGITSPNQVKEKTGIRTAAAATISNASPGVVTMANSFAAGDAMSFTTTGTLPTGLSPNTTYYVSTTSLSTSSFQVADTRAHAIAGTNSINTSSAGSGTHTGYAYTLSDLTNNLLITGDITYTGANTFSGSTTTIINIRAINGFIGDVTNTHIIFGSNSAGPTDLIEFFAPSGGRFGYIDDRGSGVINMTGGLQTGNASVLVGSTVTLTDGAGALTGTLTNAPKVGNPVKWVEISDNGTTLKIPAWSAS